MTEARPQPLEATPPGDGRGHIPALDGVRGLAALLVMIFHFGRAEVPGRGAAAIGFVAQFGWGGVDLFFVLSGFLICGILLDTRDRPGFLRTFYTRRALRIFPLYFAFLAAYLFVFAPLLPGASNIYARQQWLWLYVSNFDVAAHGWYTGAGSHANHLWSLAIEEQFYLLAPFAVLVFTRRGLGRLAVVCGIGALALRVALAYAGYPGRWGYVLTFTRVDALCLGALLALAARHGDWMRRLVPPARIVAPLAFAGVAVFAFVAGNFDSERWRTLELGLPVLTIGFAALLVLAVGSPDDAWVRRAFESRALRFLGIYSYSLYMWHPLVGAVIRRMGVRQASVVDALGSTGAVLVTLAVKIAAATLVALASYYVIERPFLKLKNRSRAAAWRPVGVSSTALSDA
jgi:peptidoglycan/LPS O-acetylase OafA/YrhL